MKIVYIKWRDAHYSNDNWTERELKYMWEKCIFETVGFLCESTIEDEVVICQSINSDGRKEPKIWGIPKIFIIEMKELDFKDISDLNIQNIIN